MRDIWVISDTHFGHENIIKYCKRPFSDASDMDEYMVSQWNDNVKNGDIVYHLGDVCFGDYSIIKRLKGRKRLIVGNHDNIMEVGKYFQKVMMWRMFPEFGLLFTHVPVHENTLRPLVVTKNYKEGAVGGTTMQLTNVHGHIHQNKSPSHNYFNASVEWTNYTPVHIDTILSEISKPRKELDN